MGENKSSGFQARSDTKWPVQKLEIWEETGLFCVVKTKALISFAVTRRIEA